MKPRIAITYLAKDQIKPSPFNPPMRTTEPALASLVESIKTLGFWDPLLVSRDGWLIDGHRRYAAGIIAGEQEFPVIISTLGLQEAWSRMNMGLRPVKDADWVAAVHLGMDLIYAPPNTRRNIKAIKELLGDNGVELLAGKGMSTSCLQWARSVCRYIQADTKEYQAKVLLWIINLNQQTPARRAMEYEIAPAELKKAIDTGKRVKPVWMAMD